MSTDAGMIPTATGYDLVVKLRPAHRALMTARNALLNFETKAGLRPQPEHGAHYVGTFEPAALLAEYNARATAWRDVPR